MVWMSPEDPRISYDHGEKSSVTRLEDQIPMRLRLLDGWVIFCIVIVSISISCLVAGSIFWVLVLPLRLVKDSYTLTKIVTGLICFVAFALAFPMMYFNHCLMSILFHLYGQRCPSCCRRYLKWSGGTWKFGDKIPGHHYFECANCGAAYRRLYSSPDDISDLEKAKSSPWAETLE
jgi:hypothetical protein